MTIRLWLSISWGPLSSLANDLVPGTMRQSGAQQAQIVLATPFVKRYVICGENCVESYTAPSSSNGVSICCVLFHCLLELQTPLWTCMTQQSILIEYSWTSPYRALSRQGSLPHSQRALCLGVDDTRARECPGRQPRSFHLIRVFGPQGLDSSGNGLEEISTNGQGLVSSDVGSGCLPDQIADRINMEQTARHWNHSAFEFHESRIDTRPKQGLSRLL